MELTHPAGPGLPPGPAPIDLHAPRAAAVIMLAVACAFLLVFDLLLLGIMMALADGPNPIFSGFMGPMLAFTGFGLMLAVYQMRLPRTAWLASDHLGLENWFGYSAIPWDSIAYAEQAPHNFPTGEKGQTQRCCEIALANCWRGWPAMQR